MSVTICVRARRRGRHRRGADRGVDLEPERAAPDEPVGSGRHHVDARPGPRRSARADLLRLSLPPQTRSTRALIASEALKVGRRLASEGVIGRARVDFALIKDVGWALVRPRDQPALRRTTHPLFAFTALTDGAYDRSRRVPHPSRRSEALRRDRPPRLTGLPSLTPDDLLDVVAEHELGWSTDRETGVVLHMVSALAVAGRIGLTAIETRSRRPAAGTTR